MNKQKLLILLLNFFSFAGICQAGVRVVPERADDLAFENDVVAFRIYGPALRNSAERSGLDCWMKSVSYPIIDKWYAGHVQGISYHEDHGEGYDAYHVGASLGAGGIGLWIEDKLVTPNVYNDVSILDSQDNRAEFIVEYMYEAPHQAIMEQRHFVLEPGSQLLKVTSQFFSNGVPCKQIIAAGVTTHDGKAEATFSENATQAMTWELIDGKGLGTALMIPYRRDQKTLEIKSETPDASHALIIGETDTQGRITYFTGFAWEGAGKIHNASEWSDYLESFQSSLPERFYISDPNAGFKTIDDWETYIRELPYQPRHPNNPPYTVDLEATSQQPFIKSVMDRVIDFQTQAYGGQIHVDLQAGTFYTGVYASYQATQDSAYQQAAYDWAEAADWNLGERILNADTICMGQTMMDIYLDDPNERYIHDIKPAIDAYFDWKTIKNDQLHGPNQAFWGEDGQVEFKGSNLWWWCDALYMAPPVLARLHTATNDPRYLELLNELYWDTVDFLYDERSHLFFRDMNYFPKNRGTQQEQDKIFWGRGNGWVYGGLIRVLDHLPESNPMYQRYLKLYQEMTRKLVTLQRPDGLWHAWLNRPDLEQTPETSGTAFFTFGLLAGINRGWLDAQSYLPVALKGWNGLLSKISPEGRLGFAQLVGDKPRPVRPESFVDYTHGAFLLAASELYKMELNPEKLAALMPPYERQLILKDAAWTWYNDERAIIADSNLYVGGVNREGRSVMLPYHINPLSSDKVNTDPYLLSSWTQADDHNNPGFLRFDDKLLVVYAKHHTENAWNYRIATVPEVGPWQKMNLDWSEEKTFQTDSRSTYTNLFQLEEENGRIYNFYRADGFNPNVAWSDDGAQSWQGGFQYIFSGDGGTRPYVKYVSNGKDRIDLIYTDGHPRREANNNLYHITYQDGTFYNSRLDKIRDLDTLKENPIRPEEGTLIYDGSGPGGRAWSHDFAVYQDGTQIAAFITSPDGAEGGDLRYWIAIREPGSTKWINREIAYAGSYNYTRERHYSGGISLDPEQKGVIYISADVNPHDGTANNTGRYQIFRTKVKLDSDQKIHWQQLSFDAKRDNLRPFVPIGHDREVCVLWSRGDYRSYIVYDCDIYGIGF